jgi:hypothetical protein
MKVPLCPILEIYMIYPNPNPNFKRPVYIDQPIVDFSYSCYLYSNNYHRVSARDSHPAAVRAALRSLRPILGEEAQTRSLLIG